MTVFVISSVIPTTVPKARSLLKTNTKSTVVKVATILQETALATLLTGFSIKTKPFFKFCSYKGKEPNKISDILICTFSDQSALFKMKLARSENRKHNL
jgi:hypothetical protein